MEDHMQPPDGALPFSDVTGLLAAAASAEKQQALVARIYLPTPSDPASSSSIDQFAQLSNTAKQFQRFIEEHTRSSDYLDSQDYIWHREPPSVSVVSSSSSSRPSTSKSATQQLPHILFHLRTGGECIEDEWFATHLLLRASIHFAQQQLCITVEDEDGQFLLIEAADHLPDWVTPEAVANRVWIFEGHLHLIPPHYKSNEDSSLSTSDAVRLVEDKTTRTRVSDDIEAAAFARAYEFPSAAKPHYHRTLAFLPRRVAQVLTANPQLVSSCVTSIQSRDIVSSRSGSRLVHFPPPASHSARNTASDNATGSADGNEIVLTPVRMTRHLYAQLLYDRFFPPRQLGAQWQAAVEKYRARLHNQPSADAAQPKIEDEDVVQAEMRQGRWYDLGAKVWCGLEMAYTESLSRRTRTRARPMAPTESAAPAGERQKLTSSLTKLGYFQGEIEGSAKWKQLEAEALSQYVKGSSNTNTEGSAEEVLLCDLVDSILQHVSSTPPTLKTFSPNAPLTTLKEAEDGDSWLQLDSEDIESVLQSKSSTSATAPPRAIDEQDTFQRLGAFNSKMEDFIRTKSDVQGALFENELNEEDMQLDDEDLLFEDMDEDEQEDRVRAEVEQRMKIGGEEEKKRLVERLIPRMSDDEWTREPPTISSSDFNGAENSGKEDFLTSIDRVAAEHDAKKSQRESEGGKEVATRRDNNLTAAHEELQRRLASQYMREICSLLNSQGHERYDGASDSDDEELEEETSPEVRRQRAREFDIEPDQVNAPLGEGEWEDIGEPKLDDEETEVGNLLEFARISLGLTQEQYGAILAERESKGKFVPSKPNIATKAAEAPTQAEEPEKLDTFQSVMAAMESQLHHLQSSQTSAASSCKPPGEQDEEKEMGEEEEELLSHLLKSGSDLPASLLSQLDKEGVEAEQLEGFLRSFQAQMGTSGPGSGSGPVEVLMRRFGLGSLPADQDSSAQS